MSLACIVLIALAFIAGVVSTAGILSACWVSGNTRDDDNG